MTTRNLHATVNEVMRDRAIAHAVYMRRLSNGEARRIAKEIERLSEKMVQTILTELMRGMRDRTVSSSVFRTKQYRVLRDRIKRMVKDIMRTTYSNSRAALEAVSRFEASFQKEMLRQVTQPIGLGAKSADLSMLRSSIVSRPFEGRVLAHWWRDFGSQYASQLDSALKVGIVQGESIHQMAKRVRDVMGVKTRQAHAVMRTAVNHVSAHAREETFRSNSDLIKGVQFVATLDDRTTLECAALDGKVFPIDEGPRPPIHFNCRSTTVPVLVSASSLGLKDIPLSSRAAMDGRAAGTDTYGSWLKRQSEAVQNSVLGVERAELFRSGQVSIDRFVDDSYRPLTLDQVRKREGVA